jgi:hypothetical protein
MSSRLHRALGVLALSVATAVAGACDEESDGPPVAPAPVLPDTTLWQYRMAAHLAQADSSEPGSERLIIRMIATEESTTVSSVCEDGAPILLALNDSTVSWVGGAAETYTGTWSGDAMSGVVSDSTGEIGAWSAARMADGEYDTYSCVEWSADAFLILLHDSLYVLMAEINDLTGLVDSAWVSGDGVSGSFSLDPMPARLSEQTHRTDFADTGLIVSTGSEPAYPLDYTIHLEFGDGTSSDQCRTVTRFWYTDL